MNTPTVSIIIPARNERFLPQTIDDLCAKARGEIEIIAMLDGYWPDRVSDDRRVHYVHFTEPRGMRPCLNAGVELARGEFVMKLDAHCMVSDGFDVALAEVCRDNWVCVPTRYRLDAENWQIDEDGRPPINYLRIDLGNDEFNGTLWKAKNGDRSLDAERISDLIACQGSAYFMRRDHWLRLDLLDVEHYGTFRKDPQEVLFKTWTSGGRCVRVKGAWYAHLHKGKRYGRGYSTESEDWRKGDEYVKRWWAGTAWDKSRIPLQQIIRERFADMPGWENHEWTKGEKVTKLPNTYQVLKLADGTHFTRPRPEREASRFWNEGRWETFVKPLLPPDARDMTFVEMGADCGLYLKMARDYGFSRAVGIEKNQTPVRIGREWRDTLGGDWSLLKRKLGGEFGEAGTFDLDEMPVADVTLMSCWHYYIPLYAWLPYLDRLAGKTCNVIIVSRPELDNGHWLAQAGRGALENYFDGWFFAGEDVTNASKERDAAPRDLYSICYISPALERASIDQIITATGKLEDAKQRLARKIVLGKPFDPMATTYAQLWRERKSKWSERTLQRFVTMKVDVMRSVFENGLREPLIVQHDGKLSDGGHRLAMLRAMGHESAIVRRV